MTTTVPATPGLGPVAAAVVDRARSRPAAAGPLVVGLAGGVAVGKSTIAAAVADGLRDGHDLDAAVVSSDGFLLPNAELLVRGLSERKGFPESYDGAAIESFLADVRAGRDPLTVPVYDHLLYDVLPERRRVRAAPVVILEGVNVLHFAEHLDLGVYVDAAEPDVRRWFVERVLALRTEAASVPGAYLAPYAGADDATVGAMAEGVWEAVNLRNLVECIEPTRARADVVVVKAADHSIREVRFRGAPA